MVAKKPPSIPSTEQARKRLTVAQLKTILKSVHLSVDGLKADLLKRLETHVSNNDDDDDDDSKKTTKTTKTTTKTSKKRGRSAEKEKEEEDNDDGKEEEEEEEEEDKGALNAAAGEKRNDDDAKKASELGEIDADEEAKDSKMAKEPTTKKAKVNDDADGKEKTGGKSVENLKTTEVKPLVPLAQIGAYERLFARRLEIRYENFPADADEKLVRRVFETYGDVQEIFCSSSEGVVQFQTQEAAESALAALENGSYVMDGCEKGVKVRWATWEEDLKSNATRMELDLRKFIEEQCDETVRCSKQIWIGASSKLASDELVKAWLERFGEVESFKAFRKEKHFSFLATYAKEEDARLCQESLNEKQPPGSLGYHAPLRVEFTITDEKTRMNLEKMAQKVINPQQQQQSPGSKARTTVNDVGDAKKKEEMPAKKQQDVNNNNVKRSDSRDTMPPGMVVEAPSSSQPTTPDVIANYLRSVYPNGNKLPRRGQFNPPNMHHYGPPSEKLYVSSIPQCYDKNAIAPIFEALGAVTDVHILYDRQTKKHKGSGFVTFRSFEDAERTIALLDQKYILDNKDPNLPTNKPIYFKFAKGNQHASGQQQMFQQGYQHGGGGQSMQSMAMQNQQQYLQMQQMQQMQQQQMQQQQQQQQYWQMMSQQQHQQFQQQQGQPFNPQQFQPPQ